MSSATRTDPQAARNAMSAAANTITRDMGRIAALGMSPRQQRLNRLWSFYCCAQYDARKVGWDGKERPDALEHEVIATQGSIPSGFYDASGDNLPLQFRRPTAPYHLARVIVDRFTSLLFGERLHPLVQVEGDSDAEDYARALADASRLWPACMMARNYGGATGSACLGFVFRDGRPYVEAHDPRWCKPRFSDRRGQVLASLDIRYITPVEKRDPESGEWVEVPHWYRRSLDTQRDVVYKLVPVGDGDEPEWIVDEEYRHDYGFCPAVWIQNLPVGDALDGEPDCHGAYDMIEAIDALIAQAHRAVLANLDPTVVIVTKAKLDEIRKGSDNAIKLPEGSAQYMEMAGSGVVAAREMAKEMRAWVLEVTQCVLDEPAQTVKTATEIERRYSSMLAKASMLREQYGERGIKPLLTMMVRAVRMLSEGTVDEATGEVVRRVLRLPPRVVKDDDGNVTLVERQPGTGGELVLGWPRFFEPTLQDATLAVSAASGAKAAGLVDGEHASKFVSEHFKVDDVPAMLKRLEERSTAEQAALEAMALGSAGRMGVTTMPAPGQPIGQFGLPARDPEDDLP